METKAENRAKRDLIAKLKLEDAFKRDINSLYRQMRDAFRISVATTGRAPSIDVYRDSWRGILLTHYQRVQKAFSGTVKAYNIEYLTKQEQEDQELEDLLLLALLEYRTERAESQSDIISQTDADQMQESIVEARTVQAETGGPMDNRTIATVAAAILARKLKPRVDTIALVETQNAAENAKFQEAQVRSGRFPQSTPASARTTVQQKPRRATKRWQTVGDNKVRASHRAVNGQVVDIDEPFQIGTSLLMYPGDASLGADVEEFIRCRCSSLATFY